MHKILKDIRAIIDESMALHLPHVKTSDLEKNGAIFYMNGNNGTEFDWYVNERLPAFMTFYNDEDNLGAVKLLLYNNGETEIYIYDENGKNLIKRGYTHISANKTEIFRLAGILKNQADDQRIWDADIESINTNIEISNNALDELKGCQQNYAAMKHRKNILNLTACVSKKITEEGWKVGYMERNDPCNKEDSGWFFASGIEDEGYFSDCKNIELVCVGNVWQQLDSDIFPHIDMPIGTRLIRISEDTFEVDKNDKEIYVLKR